MAPTFWRGTVLGTTTLRALPPGTSRCSKTRTEKPRSLNSCAALRPPMPPPNTITVLDTVSSLRSTDRVHVVVVEILRYSRLSDAETVEAVEPPIVLVAGPH